MPCQIIARSIDRIARRVAGGRSLDLTCALVIGLTLINDGVAVDRRQQVLPVACTVGVGLNGRFRDRAVGIYRALFDSQQVPRCVVGVIVGLGNICVGTSLAVIVDLADELVLAVVFIGDPAGVRRRTLTELRAVPGIVV